MTCGTAWCTLCCMPMFAHDPSRLHPPPADEPAQPPPAPNPQTVEPDPPRVKNLYQDGQVSTVIVAMVLGETGQPHRYMFVSVNRSQRGKGYARSLTAIVMSDLDHDGKDCTVIIRNVEPDVSVPRLADFFRSFGFTDIAPGEFGEPQLYRTAQPFINPL